MSAPDTNIQRQQTRHKPSLIGISIAVALAGAAALVLVLWPEPLATDPDLPATTVEVGQ